MNPIHKIKGLEIIKLRLNQIKANIKEKEVKRRSFKDFGLPEIYKYSTSVQEIAIPHIFNEKNVTIISPTSTGKTLSYVLPYIQKLLENDLCLLVILPTKELCYQVKDIFDDCSKFFEEFNKEVTFIEKKGAVTTLEAKQTRPNILYSLVLCSDNLFEQERINLQKDLHVIISTPGRFKRHISENSLDLSKINYLVLDEMDKILFDGLEEDFLFIYKSLNLKAAQFFSATENDFNFFETIKVGKTGVLNEKIQNKFIFVKKEDKLEKLNDILNKRQKTLIFCNKIEEANELSKKIGLNVLHSNVKERGLLYNSFLQNNFSIVCTDLLSRGLDFKDVDVVINYDFPHKAETFIHRAGRTGRFYKGLCISFITKEDLQLQSFQHISSIIKIEKEFYDTTELLIK